MVDKKKIARYPNTKKFICKIKKIYFESFYIERKLHELDQSAVSSMMLKRKKNTWVKPINC